jgi:indole-3-glycerol phosphate synthase
MTTGGTILDEIVAHKRRELETARRAVPEGRLRQMARDRAVYFDFEHAVGKDTPHGISIVAEVKKASPSKGVLREEFDPVEIARAYEAAGADAISVLTDEKHFQGSLHHLRRVREAGVGVPLLRKDFTLSTYHVLEAAVHGADAVLLIAGVLSAGEIAECARLAAELRLAPVVEVYNAAELAVALESPCRIIQINNRDLRTFQVDLAVTQRLAPRIPGDRIVISASGFDSAETVRTAREAGAHAVLVGEWLMRAPGTGDVGDVAARLRSLRGEA